MQADKRYAKKQKDMTCFRKYRRHTLMEAIQLVVHAMPQRMVDTTLTDQSFLSEQESPFYAFGNGIRKRVDRVAEDVILEAILKPVRTPFFQCP